MFFSHSKADVKCKQHLVLLKTVYSLPSFLLFVLLPYQWQLATLGKSTKKEMLIKFSLCVIYRDLSNNILERLPPELFLSTRNLTELYVWRFHYTTRKSSFQILAECKLEREQKNRRSSWWWGYRPATPSFVDIFCSRLAIHAYKLNNYMGLKLSKEKVEP